MSTLIRAFLLLIGAFMVGRVCASNLVFDNHILDHGQVVRQLGGVNAIAQDAMGFIWIGADNGLARYDGTELRLYQSEPDNPQSLPTNFIWDLEPAADGGMWVAASKGLSLYRPETDSFERISEFNGVPLLADTITDLATTRDGRLLMGSVGGLNILTPATGALESFVPRPPLGSPSGSTVIYDMAEDADGGIWLARGLGGMTYLTAEKDHFEYVDYREDDAAALPHNDSRRVLVDHRGQVWIGFYGRGIGILSPEGKPFRSAEYRTSLGESHNAVVMDMLLDRDGSVWVVADQQGLLKFSEDLELVRHFHHSNGHPRSLLSNQTRSLMQDINGDLWVGLFPFGLSFLDRSRERIQIFRHQPDEPQSLSHDAVISLKLDRSGNLWVGTERGLNQMDLNSGRITRYEHDPANPDSLAANAVISLEEDQHGYIWIGTWSGGLQRLNPKTGEFFRFPIDAKNPHALGDAIPWSILSDRDGELWVGTESQGLHRYRPESNDFVRYVHNPENPESISSNDITKLIQDRNGYIWIATYGGLNRFDKQSETFVSYRSEEGNVKAVRTLFEDSRGFIWAGLHDAGLDRLDPSTGEFFHLTEKNGLPSKVVSSIVEDAQGNIWAGTPNGLAKINPDTFQIETYGTEHGLAGATHNREAIWAMQDGTLYIGSTEGLTAFRPEHLVREKSFRPTYITKFRLLNREVPIGTLDSPLSQSILTTRNLVLQHHHSMFSFDFVTLNYRNPGLNQYAYMLEGFDRQWNYQGQRNIATYTNLNPGHYVFRVKSKVPGEDWQEGQQTISLEIKPPLWRTWWAHTLYVILFVAFLYSIYAVGRLKKASDTYRELSVTDPLTGIYNRAGISHIAQGLFANAEAKSALCVVLIDIDHFKRVNDRRGHDVGDRVIAGVCDLVKKVIRRGDYFARWGGEEFILLCTETDENGAKILGERIRKAIAEHIFEQDREPLNVTLSLGIALVNADESFQEACKRADEVLYEAKNSGRNCVVIAGE